MFDLSQIPFLEGLPPTVREWLVRTVIAIVIFVIVLLLRRVLTWLLLIPFRTFAKRSKTDIDNTLLGIVEPATGYVVVAIGLLVSTQVLTLGTVELVFVQRLARSLIIVGISSALFQAITFIQSDSRLLRATGISIERELLPFLRTALRIVLIALTLVIVIQEWDYDVSGLIAGLGLGGLAFSLAAQDTISNLFGFSTIVGDRPFVVGEYIVTPDVEGTVERVGVRSTKIRTLDQSLIVVPNSKLADSTITNWSRLSYRRYNFTVGVTYAANSRQMRQLIADIREMLTNRPKIRTDSIVVNFTEFGASSLDVLVRCNVDLKDWVEWTAEREEINLAIMDIVENLGMGMAFPSRSVYIESMPTLATDTAVSEINMVKPPRSIASSLQQDESEDSPTDTI